MTSTDNVKKRLAEYERHLENPDLDPGVVELAEAVVMRVESDVTKVLRDDAHEDWVLHYVEQEQRALTHGDRDDSLCTCGLASCPLKNNRLPWKIKQADSLAGGIKDFRQRHPGQPRVLDEAQEEWDAMVGRAARHLRIAFTILVQSVRPRDDGIPLPSEVASIEELAV